MNFFWISFFFLPVGCRKVAIVGEGVVGLSTALALKELDAAAEVHIFYDKPFDSITSKNIAGLFRIDNGKYRTYGNETFIRLAKLWREFGGTSGVQLVSGHILSYDRQKLLQQKDNYGDIVYNFRFLEEWEKFSQFVLPEDDNSTAIHYTAFTSEGVTYCPWMKKQLLAAGVQFHERRIHSMDELADEGFPTVVNCAGIEGGRVAGDDESVYPIRGILLKVDAPWQKHFLYRDFDTFTIPVIGGVYLGTVKEENNYDATLREGEVQEIWERYLKLQPAMSNVQIKGHYVGFRPARRSIRVEAQQRQSPSGREYIAVHNYGHGGNGFTLAWGTALHAAGLVLGLDTSRYDAMVRQNTVDQNFNA